MKNVFNRILKIISSAIFVVLVIIIVLILAYVIRVKYLASQGRLGDVKLNFYTILTQSMVPTIYAGDVVITYKNVDNKYDNGDILTFISEVNGGINITHRIIETYVVNGKYSYKTKGDNNSIPDSEIVKGERVLGKVILKIPKVGFFQQFLVTNHRWIFVVVIPCLGVIIYDVIKMIKGFRKEKEYYEPDKFNDIEIPQAITPPKPEGEQIASIIPSTFEEPKEEHTMEDKKEVTVGVLPKEDNEQKELEQEKPIEPDSQKDEIEETSVPSTIEEPVIEEPKVENQKQNIETPKEENVEPEEPVSIEKTIKEEVQEEQKDATENTKDTEEKELDPLKDDIELL